MHDGPVEVANRPSANQLVEHRAERVAIPALIGALFADGQVAEDRGGGCHALAFEEDVGRLEVAVGAAMLVAQIFEGLEDTVGQPVQGRRFQRDASLDERVHRARVLLADVIGVVAFLAGFENRCDALAPRQDGSLLVVGGAQKPVAPTVGPGRPGKAMPNLDGDGNTVGVVGRPGVDLRFVAPTDLAVAAVFLGDKHFQAIKRRPVARKPPGGGSWTEYRGVSVYFTGSNGRGPRGPRQSSRWWPCRRWGSICGVGRNRRAGRKTRRADRR